MEVMKLEPYLEQRRSHGNSGPIPCPQCGKLFAKEFDIKRHMFTHTGEKPFKCEVCNRGFSQKSTLKVHLNIHTGDMPYSCQMCGKKFRQKQGLNAHVKANRCKFGNIKPTNQPPSLLSQSQAPSLVTNSLSPSSRSSDSSNSPRATDRHRPYPSLSGLKAKHTPKEKFPASFEPSPIPTPQFNQMALLKLLCTPLAAPATPPPQFIPTLPVAPQLSLAGLQNLSNFLAKYREAQAAHVQAEEPQIEELNNSNEEIDVVSHEAGQPLEDDLDGDTPLQIAEVEDSLSDKSDDKRKGRRKQAKPSKFVD